MHGLENFIGDLAYNGGLPAQVDARKFAVGKNLATMPGSVVYRSPVMELIQYRPVDKEVHERPLLIAPPQINKFYVFDLVPEKSIIQFALKGDLQAFAISWKNPTSEGLRRSRVTRHPQSLAGAILHAGLCLPTRRAIARTGDRAGDRRNSSRRAVSSRSRKRGALNYPLP
jgi:poly(3-hydroxyalkanoate) synthetase